MGSDLLLYLVIAIALAFDFTNGFHDTANAMATSIATRALRPRVAVVLAGILNFAGAFISIAVATTIAKGIVDNSHITLEIIIAGLVGAILWNLATWALSLPSSSSHALIGGLVGATLVGAGSGAVNGTGILEKVVLPALFSPFIAGAVAGVGTFIAYKTIQRIGDRDKHASNGFRIGQIGSASLVALAHGTNDAQKTMGVITLALVVNGNLDPNNFTVPLWVKLACAVAIASGTMIGGWRIIYTLGRKVTDIEPPQGFAAESGGGATLLASTYFGYPLSTTQVVSGAVLGSGVGKKLAAVHWGTAGRMASAWVMTLPIAGVIGAGAYWVATEIGGTDAGAVVLVVLGAIVAALIYAYAQCNPIGAADV
jgi:PiT family inorganic phosphate transporter